MKHTHYSPRVFPELPSVLNWQGPGPEENLPNVASSKGSSPEFRFQQGGALPFSPPQALVSMLPGKVCLLPAPHPRPYLVQGRTGEDTENA